MIVEKKTSDLEVIGESSSKQATISQSNMAKLQHLLTTGLYKDPITAVIAEWTNNGIDGVVQAGKDPVENPVIVNLGKDAHGQSFFSVEDTGVGLDNVDFETICMSYLTSTKEKDNDTIGHFGIGMKSFLALERSATFVIRKAGMERMYLVYQGEEFVNYDLIYEKETTEGNGVKAQLTIKDYSEFNNFIIKAKAKLAYYDTAVLVVNGTPLKTNIYRHDLYQWSDSSPHTNLHLTLKDVYYLLIMRLLG